MKTKSDWRELGERWLIITLLFVILYTQDSSPSLVLGVPVFVAGLIGLYGGLRTVFTRGESA